MKQPKKKKRKRKERKKERKERKEEIQRKNRTSRCSISTKCSLDAKMLRLSANYNSIIFFLFLNNDPRRHISYLAPRHGILSDFSPLIALKGITSQTD